MFLSISRVLLAFTFIASILLTTSTYASDYYWVGGSGNYSDLSHWATSSGGVTLHVSAPTSVDNIYFDANSFSDDSQEVVFNQLVQVNDFIASGITNSITFTSSLDFDIYGSFKIQNNIIVAFSNPSISLYADDTGNEFEVTQGSFNLDENGSVYFGGNGDYTLLSDLSLTTFRLGSGTVITGANTITTTYFETKYSATKTLDITNSTVITDYWDIQDNSLLTLISVSSQISVTEDFEGQNFTYGELILLEPGTFSDGTVITGSNTIDILTIAAGATFLGEVGATNSIVTSITFNGSSDNFASIRSQTESSTTNIAGTGITISGDFVGLQDTDFVGTATFGITNAVLGSNVNGWEVSVMTPSETGTFDFSKVYDNSVYIRIGPGNGAERIIFMREGIPPVVTVADNTSYIANQIYGSGSNVGTDTYVVYQGSDDSFLVEGLTESTTYSISVLEVNTNHDESEIKYSNTTTSFSKSAETLSGIDIVMEEDNSFIISEEVNFYDDGGKGAYYPNKTSVVTFNSSAVALQIELSFSELEISDFESLRIYDDTDTIPSSLLVDLSGDSHSFPLNYQSTTGALTISFISNDFSESVFNNRGWVAQLSSFLATPNVLSSDYSITRKTDTEIDFGFVEGNGIGRLIIAKSGTDPVQFVPTSDETFTGNTTLGSGQDLGNGEYAVSFGDVNEVTLAGLTADSEYTIKIYEYNQDNTAYEYATTGYSFTVDNALDPPTSASSEGEVIEINTDSFIFDFTPGNGTGRIILAKEGEEEFVFLPTDDLIYTADKGFGSGQDVGNGEFVVGNGTMESLTMSGTTVGTYSIRIIEYNQVGSLIKYASLSPYDFVIHNSILPPTTLSSNVVTNDTGILSIDFGFTPGDGDGRIVIVKKGLDPIVFSPKYNTAYEADGRYGYDGLASGEYCVGYGDVSGVNLQYLEEGETYTLKIIEYSRDGDDIVYMSEGYDFTLTLELEAPHDMLEPYSIETRINKLGKEFVTYNLRVLNFATYEPNHYFNNWLYVVSDKPIDVTTLPFEDGYRVSANNVYGEGTEVLSGAFVVGKKESYFEYVTVEGLEPFTEYHLYSLMFKENEIGVKYGLNGINHTIIRTLEQNAYLHGESPSTIDSTVLLYSPSSMLRSDCFIDQTVTYYPHNSDETLNLKVLVAELTAFDFIVYDGESSEATILGDYSDQYNLRNLSILTATNDAGALTIQYNYEDNSSCSGRARRGFKSILYNTVKTSTIEAPNVSASALEALDIGTTTTTLSWQKGDGDKSLVFLAYQTETDYRPLDGINYLANGEIVESSYAQNYYAVFNGDLNSVNLSGLVAGRAYEVWIYEYNGSGSAIKYGNAYQGSFSTVSNRPSIAATNLSSEILDNTTAHLRWENGNGARRIVVESRCEQIVNGLLDGEEFFANANLMSANLYKTDSEKSDCYSYRILYDGTDDNVVVSNIPRSDSYNFHVLEYNGNGLERNYLVSEEQAFHGMPDKPSIYASADTVIIQEKRATSVNLKLEMPNYSSTQKIAYISKTNEQIPIEEGYFEGIREGLDFENGYTLPYLGYGLGNRGLDIKFLDPNTTYFITIYAAKVYGDAVNIDLERGFQVEVQTGDFENYYWVGGVGSWSDTLHWATSSGGEIKHSKLPDLESKVIFDAQSSQEDTLTVYVSDLSIYYANSLSYDDLGGFLVLEDSSGRYFKPDFSVYSHLNLADNIAVDFGRINLQGYETSNDIHISEQAVPFLDDIIIYGNERSGVINFTELPSRLDYLSMQYSQVIFDERIDSLQITTWREYSSEVSSVPTLTGVRELTSSSHFGSVAAYYNPYVKKMTLGGNLHIDSLNLGGISTLELRSGDTLTVSNIIRDTTMVMDVIASDIRKASIIKSSKDTLLLSNVTISDNHAIGETVYVAQNSNLFNNVEGWVLEGEKELSISGSVEPYLTYGDSIEVEFTWNIPVVGRVLLVLTEGNENKGYPEKDSIYTAPSSIGADTYTFINVDYSKRYRIGGLKPETQYTVRLFLYVKNEAGNKAAYSRESKSSTFKTASTDGIFMNKNSSLTFVADNSTLYSHTGIGYDDNEYYNNEIIIEPKSETEFVSFSFLKLNLNVDGVAIYEGDYDSLLYSKTLSDEYYDKNYPVITSTQPGESLLVKYYDRGSSSAKAEGPIFYATSIKNNPADEPVDQVTGFQASVLSSESINLTWENTGKTIIIGIKEPRYDSHKTSPIDNVTYSSSPVFGKGDELTYSNYILYTGNENEVTITGLSSFSEYHFMAFAYNDGEDTDINYKLTDYPEVIALTLAAKPEETIEEFVINTISSDEVNLSYLNRVADMSLVLLKEGEEIAAQPVDGITYNFRQSYGSGQNLVDGTYFMYQTSRENIDNLSLYGLIEGTTYFYKILTINGKDSLSLYSSDGYSGQFTTNAASYDITLLSDTLLCSESSIVIDYNYLGSNDDNGNNAVILSSNQQMTDSLILTPLDSGYLNYTVGLPVDLAYGSYYLAVIPVGAKGFDIHPSKITIDDEGYEPSIERNEYNLIASNGRRVRWYLNDEIISDEESDTLIITTSGTYQAANLFGDCEYFSEDFVVKPEIHLNEEDTTETWTGVYMPIGYSSIGDISTEGLTVLLANKQDSIYDQTISVDSIDTDYIYVLLPHEMNQEYHYLKAQSDSILSFGVSTILINSPEVRLEYDEPIKLCTGYQTQVDLSLYGLIDSLDDIELAFSPAEDGDYRIEPVVDSILVSGVLYMTIPESFSGKYYFKMRSEIVAVSGVAIIEVQRFDLPIIEFRTEENALVSNYTEGNQWYQNDIILDDEINQYLYFEDEGNYQVAVQNEFCTLYSEVFELLITGAELDRESIVEIFPNPFTDKITLRYPVESSSVPVILEIYDLNARSQFRIALNPTQLASGIDLPIGDLDSGTYLLFLTQNETKIVRRLIKK